MPTSASVRPDHDHHRGPGDRIVDTANSSIPSSDVRLLISSVMKIRTSGRNTPLITCETRIICISGKPGQQHHAPADRNQQGNTASRRSGASRNRLFTPDSNPKSLANRVGRRERQNTGGKDGSIQQAGAEQQVRIDSERLKRQRRVRRVLDIPRTIASRSRRRTPR